MATNVQVAQSVYSVDSSHSLVEFSTKHMMFSTVKGRFGQVKGTLVLDDQNHLSGEVDVEIDATSIDTRDERRDGHLRSPDFFDVDNHPAITFKSAAVEQVSEERARVRGDLTIRGTTRPVTLDVTFNGKGADPYGRQIVAFSAETSINRKDFGLTWNVALETGGVLVSDAVKIMLEIEAVKS